ncbi:MAG: DUF1465 family protein [Sphingomonadaceae bacterium]
MAEPSQTRLTPRLVDSLYVEAMLLADEARSYFDDGGREERRALAPADRVFFSCESLKLTTRLMHIIAWLLAERTGEPGQERENRLAEAAPSDEAALARLPAKARELVAASMDLHLRVARLGKGAPALQPSPARSLLSQLENRFGRKS